MKWSAVTVFSPPPSLNEESPECRVRPVGFFVSFWGWGGGGVATSEKKGIIITAREKRRKGASYLNFALLGGCIFSPPSPIVPLGESSIGFLISRTAIFIFCRPLGELFVHTLVCVCVQLDLGRRCAHVCVYRVTRVCLCYGQLIHVTCPPHGGGGAVCE